MPNTFASLMLATWPLVTLALFLWLSREKALVWSLLAAYLILPPPPAGFDLPLMPALTKETIPNLAALIAVLLVSQGRVSLIPQSPLIRALIAVFILSPVATYLTNLEPVHFAIGGLPGMRPFEALAIIIQQALVLTPFLLARSLMATETGLRTVLTALFVCGLVYSLPMLLEIRLSPQLNNWIYGYFQHSFEQTIRFGGFRPIVFLYHGLWAAFFVMAAFAAGLALARGAMGGRAVGYLAASVMLGVVLVLCKSVAAAFYGLLLIPLILVPGRKLQLALASVLALVVLSYPVLRQVNLFPTGAILAQAEFVSPDRARSLEFRFENEDLLLERANLKPVFGWGTWGRNHIHNPDTGEITSVSDGRWIVVMGVFGWVGLLAEFGLLGFPVFALWWVSRRVPSSSISVYTGPLALLMAINLVDLLPNATLTPLSWLIAGTLLGTYELLLGKRAPSRPAPLETVL